MTAERAIRRKLGIPDDAERVLIFGESSHRDPNWLLTSREYYDVRIERTLNRANLVGDSRTSKRCRARWGVR